MLPNGAALGNRAVAALIAQRTAGQPPVVQRLPMDTNPGERVQHLRAAIRFEALMYRFVIDEGKATDALSNMTPDDGRQVKAIYQEKEKRNLGWIFSGVEAPIDDKPARNNLSMASRTKLLNLLAGTVIKEEPAAAEPAPAADLATPAAATPAPATPAAAPAAGGGISPGPASGAIGGGSGAAPVKPAAARPARPDAEKVRRNRQRALAASIKAAVDKKDSEAAIALIPDSMEERREIDALYKSMYGKTAYMDLFTKLPGKDGARAGALWYDEKDDADRYAIEAGVEAKKKADKEAKALESSAFGSMLGDAAKAKRQEGDKKLEAAVKKVASAGDQTTLAGKQASRERLREIVKSVERGDKSAVGPKQVGLNDDPILKAIAEGNEADEIGARLARADAVKDVSAAEVEGALRELRTLAEDEAQRTIDDAKEGETVDAAATTKAIVDGYFARFKAAFNRAQKRRTFLVMMAGRGGTDEKVANAIGVDVDTLRDVAGGRAEIDRNLALMGSKGQLDEVSELVFALASKPKDLDRVRAILGSKTFTQVDALDKQYQAKTKHTLEQDLAGTELEQAAAKFFNESREDLMEKRDLLVGGQWDRELAEKHAPPEEDPVTREAYFLKAEGDFWFRKAGQLEKRVIENRGLFARARDWSGNDEKAILDTAREDRWKAMSALSKALAPGRAEGPKAEDDPGGSGPDLPGARKAVAELRVVARRMTHAASIYKEATKKAYEDFVELVVNAASIAAGLGVTGIWLTALRTTAATVGTKLVMKGSDYSVDEFLSDIQGGMAGAAGDLAKLGMNKFVTPYVAKKIMATAGRLGMSKEFTAKVAARLGPLTLRQAEYTLSTGVSNVAQGRDVTEGQGLGDRVKGEVQGAVTAPIDERMKARKAARKIVKDAHAAGGAGADEGSTGARASAGGDAGAAETAAPTDDGGARASDGESGGDEHEASPKVSMALPEKPQRAGKPSPPAEPPPAKQPAVGAIEGAGHMEAPRSDGTGTQGKRPRTKSVEPAEGGAPKPLKGGGEQQAAAKSLEYPSGAVVLNAPGGQGPAPTSHPAAEDLKALPRSAGVQQKASEHLRQAEARMQLVNELGVTTGPMHRDALQSLREAQRYFDIAHGKAPPSLDELARVASDEVAIAEVDYALARDSDTWKAREKAERDYAAAVEEHRRANSAAAAAHAWVLSVQGRDHDHATLQKAFDAYDAANDRLKAAEKAIPGAAARKDRAAAADWSSRRAWTALRLARELQTRAGGKATPPPPPHLRKGGPVHGPDAPLAEGPDTKHFAPELWDKELVIQLKNTTSLKEHEALVFKMLQEDPTREIGLFRNSKTGEWIVVRGKKMTVVVESAPGSGDEKGGVGPLGGGQKQRWKELLDKDSDVGEWELIAHSHPSAPNQPVARIAQYPSGYKGDMSVLKSESDRDGNPKSSTIYYMHGNQRHATTFGYDPNNWMPYWIQLPGEQPVRFQTMADYHKHLIDVLAPYGVRPDLEAIPPGFPEKIGMEGAPPLEDDEP